MPNTVGAGDLISCFAAGAKNLEAGKARINELNVFPVPDGDTGTNMSMTVMSAAKALKELKNPTMAVTARTMSSGSLRGARGNSGVIMSQLVRGFCKTVESAEYVDSSLLDQAFERAVETAYKAVMKPKEGTILTVARGISEKVSELAGENDDLAVIMRGALTYGREVLEHTPELLPVLREAGVVDSGGAGLVEFLEGAVRVLEGADADSGFPEEEQENFSPEALSHGGRAPISTDDIKYGYCTEFIVNLSRPLSYGEVVAFKAFLESIGDSIVCVDDDDMVKVHVHTNHPGLAFEKGLEIGTSLSRMKVDNMREEHDEILIEHASEIAVAGGEPPKESVGMPDPDETEAISEPKAHSAFVSVCTGSGFERFFKELGVSEVIQGGQTMNPSTEDILEAVKRARAENVYILPNNKNIILAAEQAGAISGDTAIHVVPAKTIPQGIAAVINFSEDLSPEENLSAMEEAISSVKTGELTYAVRNTFVDGMEIKEGDIMGIGDRGILAVGEILNDTALDMLSKMIDEDSSMVTVYVGEDIDDESADELRASIEERYPELDLEVERGEQPVYYYIVSVE